jgi:DNA transformation protein
MQPKKDDTFKELILDQLSALRNVRARSLFGGYGLYQAGKFFGILFNGRLYFKTDSMTQASYRERGMKPFRPNAKQTLKNYLEVPADVIEEPDRFAEWAHAAICSTPSA